MKRSRAADAEVSAFLLSHLLSFVFMLEATLESRERDATCILLCFRHKPLIKPRMQRRLLQFTAFRGTYKIDLDALAYNVAADERQRFLSGAKFTADAAVSGVWHSLKIRSPISAAYPLQLTSSR